jgi:hypothetical protein
MLLIHILPTATVPSRPWHHHRVSWNEVCIRSSISGKYLEAISAIGSIICSSILMWKYSALNKEKEELCLREGIDESKQDRYRELGDASPLFR